MFSLTWGQEDPLAKGQAVVGGGGCGGWTWNQKTLAADMPGVVWEVRVRSPWGWACT